jgi:hypothetical protein
VFKILNFSSFVRESQDLSSIFPDSSSNLILDVSSIPRVLKKSDMKSSSSEVLGTSYGVEGSSGAEGLIPKSSSSKSLIPIPINLFIN